MSTYSGHTTPDEDADEDDYALPEASFTATVDDAWATPGLTAQTAFDAYFVHASVPSKTSSSVFSQLLPPLSPEEYAEGLEKAALLDPKLGLWRTDGEGGSGLEEMLKRYAWEMRSGFNVLLYGLGSKRAVLNVFARYISHSSKTAHVLVVNGFNPNWQLREFVTELENVLSAVEDDEVTTGEKVESVAHRVYSAFASGSDNDSDSDEEDDTSTSVAPHLYLLIHSLDAPALRASRSRTFFTQLLRAPRIHLCGTFDHIAFPLLVPTLNLGRLLWHDMTTLAPYTAELAHSDPAALSSAPVTGTGVAGGAGGAKKGMVSENAARHVLASVTVKAKKLFVLLGTRQLELMDTSAPGTQPSTPAPVGNATEGGEGQAYDYARLFSAARDAFVATSDAALRALLGEFKDHGLVVSVSTEASAGMGTGESLWIPMRREALGKILAEIKED